MRKFTLLILACAFLAPLGLRGQTITHDPAETDSDLRGRVGFEISKKIIKGLNISWEEELRLKNNITSIDRIYSGLGVTYRITPWFRVGAGYTFIAINHDGKASTDNKKYWDLRHRAAADLLFTYKTGKWTFTFRERPQFTFRTDSVNTREKPKCDMILRHRIKAEYKVHHLPLKPYVGVEVSNTLNAPALADGNYIDKVRSMLGVEWRISKESALEFYYYFDYVYSRDIHIGRNSGNVTITPEKGYHHILGAFYSYSF